MDISFSDAQKKLDQVTAEMIELIRKYDLDAATPFDVIAVARAKISNRDDYIRFLELSLEGRIYGEYADALNRKMTAQTADDSASGTTH